MPNLLCLRCRTRHAGPCPEPSNEELRTQYTKLRARMVRLRADNQQRFRDLTARITLLEDNLQTAVDTVNDMIEGLAEGFVVETEEEEAEDVAWASYYLH